MNGNPILKKLGMILLALALCNGAMLLVYFGMNGRDPMRDLRPLFGLVSLEIVAAGALWLTVPLLKLTGVIGGLTRLAGWLTLAAIPISSVWFAATLADTIGRASGYGSYSGDGFSVSLTPFWIALAVFLVHACALMIPRNLSTVTARKIGLFFLLGLPIILYGLWVFLMRNTREYGSSYPLLTPLLTILGVAFILPGFVVYSVPGRGLALVPLLLHYLLLAFLTACRTPVILLVAYLPLAGYCFPLHRRMRAYWRPRSLPRLPRRRTAGFTLIELLIVVAIVTIFAAGLSQVSGTVHRAMEVEQQTQGALALAEDQLALLRGGEALPPPGRHPLAPELAGRGPWTRDATVEIAEGPAAALRTVRVTVPIAAISSRPVELIAILPAGLEEAQP